MFFHSRDIDIPFFCILTAKKPMFIEPLLNVAYAYSPVIIKSNRLLTPEGPLT